MVLFDENGLAQRGIGVSATQETWAATDHTAVIGDKVTAQGIVRRQSAMRTRPVSSFNTLRTFD